jgi:hypothetical protein
MTDPDDMDIFSDDAKPATVSDVAAPFTPTADHDAAVTAALYRRAVGCETWSEKLDKFGDVHRLKADVLPDPAAARLWLQARQPDKWGSEPQQGTRVYVVQLPAVAHDAQSWLASVRPAIEHEGAGGGPTRQADPVRSPS